MHEACQACKHQGKGLKAINAKLIFCPTASRRYSAQPYCPKEVAIMDMWRTPHGKDKSWSLWFCCSALVWTAILEQYFSWRQTTYCTYNRHGISPRIAPHSLLSLGIVLFLNMVSTYVGAATFYINCAYQSMYTISICVLECSSREHVHIKRVQLSSGPISMVSQTEADLHHSSDSRLLRDVDLEMGMWTCMCIHVISTDLFACQGQVMNRTYETRKRYVMRLRWATAPLTFMKAAYGYTSALRATIASRLCYV